VHILFIDDDQPSADAFAEVAKSLGHTAEVAYDGRQAVAATLATSFDVIFFDIGLPDGDGRELCRRIRHEGASQDASVIAVTGLTDLHAEDLEPFDGFLHKPVSSTALQRALAFSAG
jgi:CheY-like chemotaxis protein